MPHSPAGKSVTKLKRRTLAKHWSWSRKTKSVQIQVLHLLRWFTHTPRSSGAFLEDAARSRKSVISKCLRLQQEVKIAGGSKLSSSCSTFSIRRLAACCWANQCAMMPKSTHKFAKARWSTPSVRRSLTCRSESFGSCRREQHFLLGRAQ